ncbi:MAG: hypothetical protein DI527_18850 [Chelatococcus sp.]|nr:MAG: hypothetical protein DI527_18850 [Chelatococcus sp.]
MNVVNGGGQVAPEPDWESIFSDVLDMQAASAHWRRISSELRDRDLLASVNAHSMQRLVMAYVIYDRSAREVAESGAVTKPRRGNSKAIARVSPHFTVMREAGADADRMEAELGLAPRRRGSAGKVERGKQAPKASDRFLKSVS